MRMWVKPISWRQKRYANGSEAPKNEWYWPWCILAWYILESYEWQCYQGMTWERGTIAHSSKVFTTLNNVTTMSTALYPWSQSSLNFSIASSTLPFMQARMMLCTMIGCGWSHTLKTLSPETKPKPEKVDCKLLMAWRISPSEVNIRAVRPSSLYSTCQGDVSADTGLWDLDLTFSILHISKSRFNSSVSRNFAYLRMAHRLWIGSMILLDMLHARQKRVVFEKISIVRRKACWAPPVILAKSNSVKVPRGSLGKRSYLSASSRITILCLPGGKVTFFCAKALILFRTTSMPLRIDQFCEMYERCQ